MARGYSSFVVLSRELHSEEGILLRPNQGYPLLGGTDSHEIVSFDYKKNASVPRSAKGHHYEILDREQMKAKKLHMVRKFSK